MTGGHHGDSLPVGDFFPLQLAATEMELINPTDMCDQNWKNNAKLVAMMDAF